MHTVASNKVSAKDRELAPRFYYKVSEKTTCGQKLLNALKMFVTFMFTQNQSKKDSNSNYKEKNNWKLGQC